MYNEKLDNYIKERIKGAVWVPDPDANDEDADYIGYWDVEYHNGVSFKDFDDAVYSYLDWQDRKDAWRNYHPRSHKKRRKSVGKTAVKEAAKKANPEPIKKQPRQDWLTSWEQEHDK